MGSSKTLQGILETSYALLSVSPDNFELLRMKIYEISIHAFLQDVLTIERMRSVIQTINMGVMESTRASSNLADENVEKAQRSACQGLCSAAGLGLSAAGLALTQFSRFHGVRFPCAMGKELALEAHALKDQIDLVTQSAGWRNNSNITRLQAHSFAQLMQPIGIHAKQADASAIPWSDQFFHSSGYKPLQATGKTNASLMLLGLLSSGSLVALLDAQAAA